jgi:glycolate oxidase iron-sulfur subunit
MNHNIPVKELGVAGEIMAHAVDACVHCGFCLPACPTYQLLGDEMDSPRGRIFLMKEVLEGHLDLLEVTDHLDRCLGCQGCVTACPSGVPYGELISTFRSYSEPLRPRGLLERGQRTAIQKILPKPALFRAGAMLGKLAKPFKGILPQMLKAPLELLPDHVQPAYKMPEKVEAKGTLRARVAFLSGCAQQVLEPNFNAATLRVLAHNGVEVILPKAQGCCGAAAMHTGYHHDAMSMARQNLKAFGDLEGIDAIISNAAGCGSGLKEYALLFKGEPEEELAKAFVAKVKDVSVFLAELGLRPIVPLTKNIKVAYHDACHLAHAQGVKAQPRAILREVAGLELLEVPEGDLCCGSAGTYNLEQPVLAGQLGERKARNILATGADMVVSGNIGCHTQIKSHLAKLGRPIPIYHTLELLDLAYRGEL